MTNKQKYQSLSDKIDALAEHCHFTDPCVDAENCNHIDDDSDAFWEAMLRSLHNTAGMRISEAGLNPADFGVEY